MPTGDDRRRGEPGGTSQAARIAIRFQLEDAERRSLAAELRKREGEERQIAAAESREAAKRRARIVEQREASSSERTLKAQFRHLAAEARRRLDELQGSESDERQRVADERDREADEREWAADQRERAADAREQAADARERAANAREQAADQRERAADQHDQIADQREWAAAAERGPPSAATGSPDSAFRTRPEVRASATAVRLGVLLIAAGVAPWLFGDSARRQLGVDRGAPVAIPVDLPSGYDVPDSFGYGTDAMGRPDKSLINVEAATDAAADASRQVHICVDDAANDDHPCGPEIAGDLVRVVDGRRIVISLPEDSTATRAEWQSVQFTTHVDDVAWLD